MKEFLLGFGVGVFLAALLLVIFANITYHTKNKKISPFIILLIMYLLILFAIPPIANANAEYYSQGALSLMAFAGTFATIGWHFWVEESKKYYS